MGVGLRIKEILRQQGMTIKQLAEKAGISQNTLYSITKRDSQKVDKVLLLKIAAALNCDVDLLQTGMKNEEFATGLKRVSEAAKGAQELAPFYDGESFYGGNVKVKKINKNPDDTFSITFEINEDGVPVSELKVLMDFLIENKIKFDGLLDLIEAATKFSQNPIHQPKTGNSVPIERSQNAPTTSEGKNPTLPESPSEGPQEGK